MFRAVLTIGGFTLISRVLGFVRDVLFAAVLGAGPVADAFFVAFRLPNLFRALFAEGAFNAAFVPLYAGRLVGPGGLKAAQDFAEDALAVLTAALVVLCVVAVLAMPVLMAGLAPGFRADPAQFALAVELTQLTFPYLLFISLASLFGALLNAHRRFGPPAATPILLNVVLIAGLVGPARALDPAYTQAIAITIAGMAQFLWLAISAGRAGLSLRLRLPRLSPRVRELLRLMGPAVVGAGAMQINVVVNTIVASLLGTGAVSYLFYADRLNQLPLGIVGVAVGTALLSTMARGLAQGHEAEAVETQNRALEMALLLTLPAATAFIAVPDVFIGVLFERGAFDGTDVQATAMALAAYAIGLPAYVAIRALTPGFHARKDTGTPLRVALATIVINLGLTLALMGPLAHVGLALATALAAWANAGILAVLLVRRGHFRADARLKRRLPRMLLASLAMGGGLLALRDLLLPWLAQGLHLRLAALAIICLGGFAAFLLIGRLVDAYRVAEVKALLRRG
ncbi:murein biosynthesis integral membrane protein MurJ [Zavarzinia sp. CC-PAN008]|uniref:murein biosynthesis integral membrane protein MurJ n=1 Tax=Zavarzinia sp. CC-PAN008 TaxID=3243332 RepID=UPI003F743E39